LELAIDYNCNSVAEQASGCRRRYPPTPFSDGPAASIVFSIEHHGGDEFIKRRPDPVYVVDCEDALPETIPFSLCKVRQQETGRASTDEYNIIAQVAQCCGDQE
jgi:hypothetical protein